MRRHRLRHGLRRQILRLHWCRHRRRRRSRHRRRRRGRPGAAHRRGRGRHGRRAHRLRQVQAAQLISQQGCKGVEPPLSLGCRPLRRCPLRRQLAAQAVYLALRARQLLALPSQAVLGCRGSRSRVVQSCLLAAQLVGQRRDLQGSRVKAGEGRRAVSEWEDLNKECSGWLGFPPEACRKRRWRRRACSASRCGASAAAAALAGLVASTGGLEPPWLPFIGREAGAGVGESGGRLGYARQAPTRLQNDDKGDQNAAGSAIGESVSVVPAHKFSMSGTTYLGRTGDVGNPASWMWTEPSTPSRTLPAS